MLIDLPAFAPKAGANDAYHCAAISESDRKNTGIDAAKTIEALLQHAVPSITRNDTLRVLKCMLRISKTDAVLELVLYIFDGIPFEAGWHGDYH